jgi:hypothetical protein
VFGSVIYRENVANENRNEQTDAYGKERTDLSQQNAINKTNPNPPHEYEFWTAFNEMPETFKGIVIGCVWIAIISLLMQVISSGVILFSARKVVIIIFTNVH